MVVLSAMNSIFLCRFCLLFFFFFQAEDGIRDHCVTGVQTCALPISVKQPSLNGLTTSPVGNAAAAVATGLAAGAATLSSTSQDNAEPTKQIGRASCRERG